MRWVRLGTVGAAMLLTLHAVMLAGVDLGHPHLPVPATLDHQQAQQALAVAHRRAGCCWCTRPCPPPGGHASRWRSRHRRHRDGQH